MSKRWLIVFLLMFAISWNVIAQDRGGGLEAIEAVVGPNVTVGKTWAVFIAIDQYREGGWKNLNYPVRDAREIQQILREHYIIDNWRELYNENANAKGIITFFDELRRDVGRADSVFVFHAGHGFKDERTDKGAWIPNDAGYDSYLKSGWISHDDIRILLDRLPARHVFLVSDSCYSGDLLANPRSGPFPQFDNEFYRRAYGYVSRQVMTSGASEEVPDTSDFARRLKDALRRADGACIDPLKLYDQVRVARGTTPRLGSMPNSLHHPDGSFLFFRKQAIPAITAGFNINGGSGATPSSQTVNAGSIITLPGGGGFSRTGYTFGGWNTNANGTGINYNAASSYTPSANVTLYARWTLNRYSVSFRTNDGTPVPTQLTVDFGSKITSPPAVTKQFHSLSGWYKEEACINEWNFNTDIITTDTVLYARWTQILFTITADFNINGGSGTNPSSQTVNVGSGITLPGGDGFSRTGYTFDGWGTRSGDIPGIYYYAGSSYTPSANVTLYAKWTRIPYYVYFYSNDGMPLALSGQTVYHGGKISSPPAVTKQSHSFDGWYREEACINEWNFDRDTVTADTVLYARWIMEEAVSPIVSPESEVLPPPPPPPPSWLTYSVMNLGFGIGSYLQGDIAWGIGITTGMVLGSGLILWEVTSISLNDPIKNIPGNIGFWFLVASAVTGIARPYFYNKNSGIASVVDRVNIEPVSDERYKNAFKLTYTHSF